MLSVSQETLRILKLFSEKAGRLAETSTSETVLKKINGRVNWTRGEGWSDEYSGPIGESLEAYVLTLRLFIQDNDSISLRKMSKLYSHLPVDSSFSERFEEQRTQLNGFLDSKTPLSIEEGRQLSYREIFEIFVYGSLAHTKPEKHQIYSNLRNGSWFGLFQFCFAECLRAYVLAIGFMKTINDELLGELCESA